MTASAPMRDFLAPLPDKPDQTISPDPTRFLKQIATSLRILTPTIRTTTVVHNTALDGSISDVNPHRITFEIGGRPVMVHRIMIGGYIGSGDQIHLSLDPALYGGGMSLPEYANGTTPFAYPIIMNISVSELYVASKTATSYYINRQPPTGDVLFVYGWTSDDWQESL